ncbi:unnamed protein product [Camellia sinensis]
MVGNGCFGPVVFQFWFMAVVFMPRQFSGWSVVWHQPGVGGLIGGLCSPAILCRWCVFIASRARWYDFASACLCIGLHAVRVFVLPGIGLLSSAGVLGGIIS